MRFKAVEWHESLPSTNSTLRGLVDGESPALGGTVIAARGQTAGRGRGQRQWVSAPGKDLTFSFLLRVGERREDLAAIPLVAGLGAAEGLASLGLGCRLKWPNDILVGGRKICGILAEQVAGGPAGGTAIIVGMGVNVNMSEAQARQIDRPATSILIETGRNLGVEEVLKVVLERVAKWIDRWEVEGFGPLIADWAAGSDDPGREVVVTQSDGSSLAGIFRGLGRQGELLLEDAAGNSHTVWAGDMSPVP